MERKSFTWRTAYFGISNALRRFRSDRTTLIENLKASFGEAGLKLPTLDYDGEIRDIDPFTVMGFFNRGLRGETRDRIVGAVAKAVGTEVEIPSDYDGIPRLNNLMSCFTAFTNDEKFQATDVETLWTVFELAIRHADGGGSCRDELAAAWNRAVGQHCVRWNLSMALFWIRPETFVSLDSNNRQLLRDILPQNEALALGEKVPGGDLYLRICDFVRERAAEGTAGFTSIPDMSFQAWSKEAEFRTVPGADVRRRVWFWAPGYQGSEWTDCQRDGIVCLGWDEIGPLDRYASREELERAIAANREEGSARPKNASLACWEFVHELRQGDVVVAKSGLGRLLGVGVVTGNYRRDANRADYKNVRPCRWLTAQSTQSPVKLPMKTLTDMTPWPDVVDKVLQALHFDPERMQVEESAEEGGQPDILDEDEVASNRYTKETFLREVFLSSEAYDRLLRLTLLKKNVVLTGAPGVGKTFAAKRFASSLIGARNSSRIAFVQFHQSYGYEDFIGGFRPTESGGFAYVPGVFANFCELAAKHPGEKFCFIIDEINRGNLSKIFGELLMLLEADKRGCESVALACTKEPFCVPENVYVIGMMNTADRSLALMDYALRRRLSFYPMSPAFDSEGFRRAVTDARMLRLVEAVKQLNEVIRMDESLGEGFVIGHSFFMGEDVDGRRMPPEDVIEFELAPTLREYWFDNVEQAEREIDRLRRAIA